MNTLDVGPLDLEPLDQFGTAVATFGAALPVRDESEYADCARELKHIKSLKAEGEAALRSITQPLRLAEQRARDMFRPIIDRLAAAERDRKDALLAYDDDQRRKAAEAQRLAREAEAKERDRLAKLAAKAEERGNTARAEEYERQAESVAAPIVAPVRPVVAGITRREEWDFEITDANAIPREYLVPDMARIRGVVKSLKGDTNIPGVRAYSRSNIAAGSR